MLTFAYPWLFLLILFPLLLAVWRSRGQNPVAAPVVPFGARLARLPGVQRVKRTTPLWRRLLIMAAWILLIAGLARPQWIGEAIEMPVSGRDMLMLVDISPSMEERDMHFQGRPINRLQAVKRVMNDFIAQREGDRLGLILFGTQPYVQSPLSFDLKTVRTLLNEAGLGMAGRATAIGDAIGLAVKRLRDRPQDQRVIILVTDGANTAGELPPEKAAEIAEAAGVKIYTIGIGAETIVRQGLFGNRRVNPSRDLDEELLKAISAQTGGEYFRAASMPELALVYESINQLEPTEVEARPFRPTDDLYYWPLAGSAALVALLLLTLWRPGRKELTHAG